MPSPAVPESGSAARPGAMAALLEAVDLECVRDEAVLFSGLSFALAPGEVLQLSGPNGSGKTSLLRILCGLGVPERGEVRWRGAALGSGDVDFLESLRYLGHQDGVSLDLSCVENLEFACALASAPARPIGAILDRTGLGACAALPARRLSAGQRRRLAIARMLLAPAELWLLDEPFTALDAAARALVNELIEQHAAAGGAAIVASHEPVELRRGVRRLEL